MQKISSYLYPNRINVVADVAVFPVRWNIVYQNRVKIYQGVDNLLTIDVKNPDQKRIDISSMVLEMNIMDVNGQALATLPVTPTATLGLATVNVTPDLLSNLTPQFLSFTIYRVNQDLTKTLLYADTQFGATGNMELVGSAVPKDIPPRYITRWLERVTNVFAIPVTKTWYSDAVEVKYPNHLDAETTDSVDFEFFFNGLDGVVTVEFTKDPVVSSSITWQAVDEFVADPLTSTITRTYSYENGLYDREWAWARVTYVRATDNTGNIDKVIIRF